MKKNALPQWLRHPYVMIVIALLVLADIGGAVHAMRLHGRRDGVIAIVFPPYGLYRGVESLMHRTQLTDEEMVELSKTPEGREQLSQGMQLKENVWTALLTQIEAQPKHEVRATMEESNITYDISAVVQPGNGDVTLNVQSRQNKELSISMIDMDRDQVPDTLKIVKTVKGKAETHVTPLSKFTKDDATEFLLAWSLAWGTIAEEQQIAAMKGSH